MRSYSWRDGGPSSRPIRNPRLDGKTVSILCMAPHKFRQNRGISGRRWGVLEACAVKSRKSSNDAGSGPRQS